MIWDETKESFNSPRGQGPAEFTGNGNGKVWFPEMQEKAGSARLEGSHLLGGGSLCVEGWPQGTGAGAAATAKAGGFSG